jgi:hypothetical protein
MEERQDDQVTVAGPEPPDLAVPDVELDRGPVSQLHALGRAGGAGGKDDLRQVVRRSGAGGGQCGGRWHALRGAGQLVPAQHRRRGTFQRRSLRADVHHMLEVGEIVVRQLSRGGLAEQRIQVVVAQEPLLDDQRSRLGAPEQFPDLGAAVTGVERDHDPAGRQDAERRGHPATGVGGPQPDAVTGPDTQRGKAPGGEQHIVGQLGEGQHDLAVDDRRKAGVGLGAGPHQLGDRARGGRVAHQDLRRSQDRPDAARRTCLAMTSC